MTWLPGKDVILLAIVAALVDHGQDIVEAVRYLIHQGTTLMHELSATALPSWRSTIQQPRNTGPFIDLLDQANRRFEIKFQSSVDEVLARWSLVWWLVRGRRTEIVMVLVHNDGWICLRRTQSWRLRTAIPSRRWWEQSSWPERRAWLRRITGVSDLGRLSRWLWRRSTLLRCFLVILGLRS